MRILFITTYFQPDIASTGVLMTQLAEELARLGHRITVLTSVPHYDINRIWDGYRGRIIARERRGNLDIYRLYLYVPSEKRGGMGRLVSYGSFNALSAMVGVAVGRHDVVFTPSPPLTNGVVADLLGRIWRSPFVYNVQDIWPDVAVRAGAVTSPRAIAFFQAMERHVYRRATALTVISEGLRCNLAGKGVPPDRVHVIPNFVDTDFIRPLPKPRTFTSKHGLDGKFVVLFAGNVGHSQDLKTVLHAALQLADLRHVQFLIVGNGVAKTELEAHAQRLRIKNVLFMPFQPHALLPELYASSDICLVPLRRGFANESVPSKALTIMASGRPLVASLDEGSDIWQLVNRSNCGLCVEPENPHSLAEAIRKLCADAALREYLGARGREHVAKHYSRQAAGRQYHELFASLAQEAKVQRPRFRHRSSFDGSTRDT